MVHAAVVSLVVEDEAKKNQRNVRQPSAVPCRSESSVAASPSSPSSPSPVCGDAASVPTFLDGRYLLGDKIWHAPSHRKCVDVVTGEHFLCQVTSREPDVTKLPSFVAHIRLEGHSGVNPIHKILVGPGATYVLYRAWGPGGPRGPQDLQALLQTRRRLPESHCRLYFRQIAALVRDAHAAGVVLRDLKLRKFVFKDVAKRGVCLETLEDAVVLGLENGGSCSPPSPPRMTTATSSSSSFSASPPPPTSSSLTSSTASSTTALFSKRGGDAASAAAVFVDGDDMLTDRWRCVPYCPPEILNSRKDPYSGRKADLWSLGVILYTMLVGRYPFSAAKDPTVVSRIRRGAFSVPPHVSPEAASLVRALLQKDPDARLTAAQCLSHPWVARHRCRDRLCPGDDAAAAAGNDCCWDGGGDEFDDDELLDGGDDDDEDALAWGRWVPTAPARMETEMETETAAGTSPPSSTFSSLRPGGVGRRKPVSRTAIKEEVGRRLEQLIVGGAELDFGVVEAAHVVPDVY